MIAEVAIMSRDRNFQYRPLCSEIGCGEPAVYKIAATWSDGTSHELKNYGLACERHRTSLVEQARRHHAGLRLSDGETVGPVELYVLLSGCRDAQLSRLNNPSNKDDAETVQ
jgi:hypothetical protein